MFDRVLNTPMLRFFTLLKSMQKQPPRGVLSNRCSENMQQIYRRLTVSKCDYNKVAKQLAEV